MLAWMLFIVMNGDYFWVYSFRPQKNEILLKMIHKQKKDTHTQEYSNGFAEK